MMSTIAPHIPNTIGRMCFSGSETTAEEEMVLMVVEVLKIDGVDLVVIFTISDTMSLLGACGVGVLVYGGLEPPDSGTAVEGGMC